MRLFGLLPLVAIGCTALPPREAIENRGEEPVDSLTLAAESLARGEESAAAGHFESYVRKNPDQVMFRAHLADLLFKLHRIQDAKVHYERFIADAQEMTSAPKAHLVHCHTKLMEIAQLVDDPFGEVFHRGVGLILLTREEAVDDETREEMLCKAIKTLREAAEIRPSDPRVQVYLAEAYERAVNSRAAECCRTAASNFAIPGNLTPSEVLRAVRP